LQPLRGPKRDGSARVTVVATPWSQICDEATTNSGSRQRQTNGWFLPSLSRHGDLTDLEHGATGSCLAPLRQTQQSQTSASRRSAHCARGSVRYRRRATRPIAAEPGQWRASGTPTDFGPYRRAVTAVCESPSCPSDPATRWLGTHQPRRSARRSGANSVIPACHPRWDADHRSGAVAAIRPVGDGPRRPGRSRPSTGSTPRCPHGPRDSAERRRVAGSGRSTGRHDRRRQSPRRGVARRTSAAPAHGVRGPRARSSVSHGRSFADGAGRAPTTRGSPC
jgi:hypothetical protein